MTLATSCYVKGEHNVEPGAYGALSNVTLFSLPSPSCVCLHAHTH